MYLAAWHLVSALIWTNSGLPEGVTLEFSQVGRVKAGTLVVQATFRSSLDHSVDIPNDLLPWEWECSFRSLYMGVMAKGHANRLPYTEYIGFCYAGEALTLGAGEEYSELIEFAAPVLADVDPSKDVVEFFWIERTSHGHGFSGILDIK